MESLNKTLKYTLGLRVKYTTKEEAILDIEGKIEQYNKAHKHGSLGKRVPYCVLMHYTAVKSRDPEGKPGPCRPASRAARTFSKLLAVKIKKINLDNSRRIQ